MTTRDSDTTATRAPTPGSSTTRRRGAHQSRARGLAVLGATLAALAVWLVASPLLGIDLLVTQGSGPAQAVGPVTVLTASLQASLAAWGLLALLERVTSRARTTWARIAMVSLLLSLAAPVLAGTSPAVMVTLVLMHLCVGSVLIAAMSRATMPRATEGSQAAGHQD